MKKVKTNDTVRVHYTGKLEDGDIFDSSVSREPLEFIVGAGQLIPGFETGIVGMSKDESRTVKIPFMEAYGPVNDDLFYDVNKDRLPDDLQPKPGMKLVSQNQDGQEMVVTVMSVDDKTVKINANHPFAGKDLEFEITVVDIL